MSTVRIERIGRRRRPEREAERGPRPRKSSKPRQSTAVLGAQCATAVASSTLRSLGCPDDGRAQSLFVLFRQVELWHGGYFGKRVDLVDTGDARLAAECVRRCPCGAGLDGVLAALDHGR